MPPSDYVISPLAQVHLLGRGPVPLRFRSGSVACGGALSGTLRRLFARVAFSYFHLIQAR